MAFKLGTDLASLQQQRARTKAELQRRGGKQKATGYANQLNQIDTAIRGIRNKPQIVPDQPLPAPKIPAPQPQQPAPQPIAPNNTAALFPNVRAFEPKNYEGSPLYQFQKKEGLKDLEKLMSARGLTKSGAEVEANSKFLSDVGAQEAQRQQGVAQQEADRLERMQQAESQRLTGAGNDQFDRQYKILELMSRQSPMEYAYGGMNRASDLDLQRAKAQAQYLSQAYARPTVGMSSGGGGGRSGGGSVKQAPFMPPFPTGPDYSAINQAQIFSNGANQMDWAKNLGNLASGVISSGALNGWFS